MALLERVTTLLRANLNDLLSKAEDPEKLVQQLILDMENQMLQIKTQMAIAIADEHLLAKKKLEQEQGYSQWVRKAELALAKEQEDLARAALERALSYRRAAEGMAEQQTDQASEAEGLRSAYKRLQQKLGETRSQADLLRVRARRSRIAERANTAQGLLHSDKAESTLKRLAIQVDEAESRNYADRVLLAVSSSETAEERVDSLERNDQVEELLQELKERQPRLR
jgi:phage shock protein A